MDIKFNDNASPSKVVEKAVKTFLKEVDTFEKEKDITILIYQDGVKDSYYIRCTLSGETISKIVSLNARLEPESGDTFRTNRELLVRHTTFLRMRADAEKGREFNDIIAEYVTSYEPERPLKVWGGQHRSRAIMDAFQHKKVSRYHGFRVFFSLSKEQRTELALISNTNIAVSNDLFDRQMEETFMGPHLRRWCVKAGLLKAGEDFPDVGARSERITTQAARSFMVNFFKGKQAGAQLGGTQLDRNVYEPYLPQSGAGIDEEYRRLTEEKGQALWSDKELIEAGKSFVKLHNAQYESVKGSKIDRKSYRLKALMPSVISAWAYVAGLLQAHAARLQVHLVVPNPPKGVPDPLNADEMANFKHYQDTDTHQGLGTRSHLRDRQKMAQLFLARTTDPGLTFDKKLMSQAVNQVMALRFFKKGYAV